MRMAKTKQNRQSCTAPHTMSASSIVKAATHATNSGKKHRENAEPGVSPDVYEGGGGGGARGWRDDEPHRMGGGGGGEEHRVELKPWCVRGGWGTWGSKRVGTKGYQQLG